jgi:hypothetical protein
LCAFRFLHRQQRIVRAGTEDPRPDTHNPRHSDIRGGGYRHEVVTESCT